MLTDTITKLKSVSVGYVGSNGLFDSATVNAYTASLRGLSETQARVALSSSGLSKAQQEQILNNLNATQSTITLTSAEMTNALTKKMGSQEKAKNLLLKSEIISKDQLETGAKIELNAQLITEAVALGKITQEEGEQLLTAFGLQGANIGLATSFKLLGKSILTTLGHMLKWLATTPLGWVTAAGIAIASFIGYADSASDALIEDTKNEIEKLDEEISKFDEEIESLESLQEKLKDAAGDKSRLAEIQEELNKAIGETPGLLNGEAKALDVANAKIAAQIQLQKDLKKESVSARKAANELLFDNNTIKKSALGMDFLVKDLSGDEIRSALKLRATAWQKLAPFFGDVFKGEMPSGDIWGVATEQEIADYVASQVDTAFNIFADEIESYSGAGGTNFIKGLITAEIEAGGGRDEIAKILDTFLSNEQLQKNINAYWESLLNPDADSESALSLVKTQIESISKNFPELQSYFDAFFEKIVGGSHEVKKTVEGLKKTDIDLSMLQSASESISSLSNAFKEVSDDGYITLESLIKIRDATGLTGKIWEKYQAKLISAKAGSTEFNQILSDLTYTILENKFAIAGLENATEEEIAAVLRENGVLNANEVAHAVLTRAKAEAILKAHDFTSATEADTKTLYKQLTVLGLSESAIKSLAVAYAEAQASMNKILAEGVESRLGIMEEELKSVKSIADAYALLGRGYDSNQDGAIDYVGSELNRLSPEEKKKYLAAKKQIIAYGKAQEEIQKLLDEFDTNVRYSNPESSSSDKDKPDKADPADAIINRIASNVEALERQGEIIDNQLDMVDAEKEYDKYVELANKALDNRLKTIEASKTAQNELSKEAQKIRDKYKGINVDSFFDADGDFTEAYNRYYNSFTSKTKQEAFEYDMKMIQEFKKAWAEYYDDIMSLEKEVFDFRKNLQETHYDHLSNLVGEIKRYADIEEKQAEKDKEYLDALISKNHAILDIKRSQFELQNKLFEAETEARKALATSKIGSEYLDENTRKLVYNEDDYELEMDAIEDISNYINRLTDEYMDDINSLSDEEMYKAEEITAQYQRRVAMKEKELEIVQAEIDLQKKQDALNNILAEKNIRQIVDGKWVWTHDTDKLRQATEDAIEAESRVAQLRQEKEQLTYTSRLEASISNYEMQQEAIDHSLDDLNKDIEKFSDMVDLLKDPLADFASLIHEITTKLSDATGTTVTWDNGVLSSPNIHKNDLSSKDVSANTSKGRIGSANPNANIAEIVSMMKENSAQWQNASSERRKQLHASNSNLGASIGADYSPSDGSWYQNGVKLYDNGGVLKGLGGIKATEKDEIVLSPSLTEQILNPEKNALFDKFADNLGTILNPDLIRPIPFNIPQPNLQLFDGVSNSTKTVTYNMNGDINISEATDGELWITKIRDAIISTPIPN